MDAQELWMPIGTIWVLLVSSVWLTWKLSRIQSENEKNYGVAKQDNSDMISRFERHTTRESKRLDKVEEQLVHHSDKIEWINLAFVEIKTMFNVIKENIEELRNSKK